MRVTQSAWACLCSARTWSLERIYRVDCSSRSMPQCGTLCLGKCVRLVEAISQCRTVSRPCGRTVWPGCRPTCVTACVTTCGCRPACVTAMLAAFQADVTWDFSPQSVPPRKTETRSDSLPLTGRSLMLQNRFIQLAEQMRQRFQKKNWWALYCWGRFTAYNLSKCLIMTFHSCVFFSTLLCVHLDRSNVLFF